MCECPTLKRLLLLTLVLLTVGCVEENAIDYDSKETVEFSEQVENQVGDYNETLEEVPKEEEKEVEIVEGITEVGPGGNETEGEFTLDTTDEDEYEEIEWC